MKKIILLVAVAAVSTFTLLSCGGEELNLVNPDGAKGPTCNVVEMKQFADGDTSTIKFTYNAKNLLISQLDGDKGWKYEYDDKDLIIKITANEEGEEIIKYEYDSKGNISKAIYDLKDRFFSMHEEFVYTVNPNGQVEKITVISEEEEIDEGDIDNGEDNGGDEEEDIEDNGEDSGEEEGEEDGGERKGFRKKSEGEDFFIEYDAKNNIKKISIEEDGKRITLLENISFDDKPNAYTNAKISNAYFPHIILGVIFGGNYTTYFNANNVLSDRVISSLAEIEIKTTYKYEYNKEGYVSKLKASIIVPGQSPQEAEQTFTYICK